MYCFVFRSHVRNKILGIIKVMVLTYFDHVWYKCEILETSGSDNIVYCYKLSDKCCILIYRLWHCELLTKWEPKKIEKLGAPECHFYLLVSGNTIFCDCIKFPIQSIYQICSGTWKYLEISLQCLQIRRRSISGALFYYVGPMWVGQRHFLLFKL